MLPFADRSFDHVVGVTSLCFVAAPADAVREMWRVCRRTVTVGLLNRRSLLYLRKARRGGYAGARWDLYQETLTWMRGLAPTPDIAARWAVFLPSGGLLARALDHLLPGRLALGSFLAVCLRKPNT
jgi:SAM-dependent methyltransferase